MKIREEEKVQFISSLLNKKNFSPFFREKDYGLRFFTTHRTLLSLSMDMKMSNGGARGERLGCLLIRITMYDDKHKRSLKNKWFLCIFIVDFYDLAGINFSSFATVKYASQAEELLIFIVHVNFCCLIFIVLLLTRFSEAPAPPKRNFFDLFDVHLLALLLKWLSIKSE